MFIVAGHGIYQFSMLPKQLQQKHTTYKAADDFLPVVAKTLDQSWLCFNVVETDD